MKKKKHYILKIINTILVLVITFTSGIYLGYSFGFVKSSEGINKVSEIQSILNKDWYFANQFEDIDQTLIDNALYGMTNNDIDIHTAYMSEEERRNFAENTNHHFVGIGIQYIAIDEYKLITNVFSGSPAFKAGLVAGDFITKIDGHSVKNLSTDEIKNLTLGEINTKVVVDILRDNQSLSFDIYRGDIGSVYAQRIDNYGYIEIMSFGEETALQLENIITDYIESDIDSFIIDLRDNGGGYLNSLIDICGIFIPKGSIAKQQVFSDGTIEIFETNREPITGINKIAILINQNTASASEAFTLAMRENFNNTTVIGIESYGKGTMQQTRTFSDGSALKFTTGRWQSSENEILIDKGITPDITIDALDIVNSEFTYLEDIKYEYNKYHYNIIYIQKYLTYLGYEITDQEGHFFKDTLDALNDFQKNNNYEITDYINKQIYMNLRSKLYNLSYTDYSLDDYIITALEKLGE